MDLPTVLANSVTPHFSVIPSLLVFITGAFSATRGTVDCHFQFGTMDKTLLVPLPAPAPTDPNGCSGLY